MAQRQLALKRTLIGRPRATEELHETLLSKKLALPIFASDPLSSVAYATEASLVVLIAASATSGHLVLPISIAIATVMAIVVVSYMQTDGLRLPRLRSARQARPRLRRRP